MTRKPIFGPETNHSQGYGCRPPCAVIPTLRPSGEVEAAQPHDWIRLADAVRFLVQYDWTARLAFAAVWKRVVLGVIPVTCETLIYERADAGPRTRETHTRPGFSVRLAEQILEAYGNPRAGFKLDVEAGDAGWADVSGPYPVDALALGILVDRSAVAMMVAQIAQPSTAPVEPMAQGRPQLAHKVMPEFERRVLEGRVVLNTAAEARALAEWYAQEYPISEGNKALQPKTIQPYIRERINALRLAQHPAGKGA